MFTFNLGHVRWKAAIGWSDKTAEEPIGDSVSGEAVLHNLDSRLRGGEVQTFLALAETVKCLASLLSIRLHSVRVHRLLCLSIKFKLNASSSEASCEEKSRLRPNIGFFIPSLPKNSRNCRNCRSSSHIEAFCVTHSSSRVCGGSY